MNRVVSPSYSLLLRQKLHPFVGLFCISVNLYQSLFLISWVFLILSLYYFKATSSILQILLTIRKEIIIWQLCINWLNQCWNNINTFRFLSTCKESISICAEKVLPATVSSSSTKQWGLNLPRNNSIIFQNNFVIIWYNRDVPGIIFYTFCVPTTPLQDTDFFPCMTDTGWQMQAADASSLPNKRNLS